MTRMRKLRRLFEFYGLAEKRLNVAGKHWGNLGFWSTPAQVGSAQEYSEAAADLAHQLAAKACLDNHSVVLDGGFGCGDQLLLWHQHYHIRKLYGVNWSHSQTDIAQQQLENAGRPTSADQCRFGNVCDPMLWHTYEGLGINRIMALDCVYHFLDKAYFLRQSIRLLASCCDQESDQESDQEGEHQALLAYTDLLLATPWSNMSFWQRTVIRLMLKLSRVPVSNLNTLEQTQQQISGETIFSEKIQSYDTEDISEQVLQGFSQWWLRFKNNHQITGFHPRRMVYLKYDITAAFLSWAYRHKLLSYQLIQIKVC